RADQRLGFVDAFLVFAFRDGISHDAGTGLDVSFAALLEHGADGDAGVEIACEVGIEDGAAVDASADRFNLFNDFHGADFGSAGEGSGGKAGGEGVHGAEVFAQLAFNGGDQVHDVRVAFHEHEVADAHGAEVAYAANVIAAEIDEHDVFGALFFVGAQFLLQAQVFGFIFTALTSSGDGAVLKLVASNADQHFRRRAENGHVSHAEEVHIRRGIHAAQRTIDAERRHTGIKLKAERRHGLKDVTGHDVFLDSLNGLEEALLLYGDVDFQLAFAWFLRLKEFAGQRLRELLLNCGNITHG